MISIVEFSLSSRLITIGTILLILAIIIFGGMDMNEMIIMSVILALMLLTGLFYTPVSIELTDSDLIIHRVLKNKKIPLASIKSADFCFPTGGGIRICGSGGFMGYWGYFHDISIGNFFGYFGKREQCVLIRLKSGRQYVVSCDNPAGLVNGVNFYLNKNKIS